jgi:hypothetical protein
VCTKFGQNPLKDVDSRVFTTMLQVVRSKVKFLSEGIRHALCSLCFFVAFVSQQKIYPKHVLPFVGIVLVETQQRRDIGMLIT